MYNEFYIILEKLLLLPCNITVVNVTGTSAICIRMAFLENKPSYTSPSIVIFFASTVNNVLLQRKTELFMCVPSTITQWSFLFT